MVLPKFFDIRLKKFPLKENISPRPFYTSASTVAGRESLKAYCPQPSERTGNLENLWYKSYFEYLLYEKRRRKSCHSVKEIQIFK